jgi:two-component system, OmpR family, response regulator
MNPALSERDYHFSVKALIVDDEKDICYLLAHILSQRNIKTRQANTLSEAEKIIDGEAQTVIFLDNHLPDGLGINNIKLLKAKSPKSKIVMITAHDNASDRLRARAEGVDYFIGKPFTKELVFNTIDKIV